LIDPKEQRHLPPRPWIVWAYLVVSVVGGMYGIALDIAHGSVTLLDIVLALVISTVAILVVWNASRVGWSIFSAWAIVFLPNVFALWDRGPWGRGRSRSIS